jgi:hypothetical protein
MERIGYPNAFASTTCAPPARQRSTSTPNTCAVLTASLTCSLGSPVVSAEIITSSRPSSGVAERSAGKVTEKRCADADDETTVSATRINQGRDTLVFPEM